MKAKSHPSRLSLAVIYTALALAWSLPCLAGADPIMEPSEEDTACQTEEAPLASPADGLNENPEVEPATDDKDATNGEYPSDTPEGTPGIDGETPEGEQPSTPETDGAIGTEALPDRPEGETDKAVDTEDEAGDHRPDSPEYSGAAPSEEADRSDSPGGTETGIDDPAEPKDNEDSKQGEAGPVLSPKDALVFLYVDTCAPVFHGDPGLVVSLNTAVPSVEKATLVLAFDGAELEISVTRILNGTHLLFSIPSDGPSDAEVSLLLLKLEQADGENASVNFGLDDIPYTFPRFGEGNEASIPKAWFPGIQDSESQVRVLVGDEIALDNEHLTILQELGMVLSSAEIDKANDATRTVFADTPASEWYVTGGYLDYVVAHGLMSGYGSNKFGPEDTLSRAQVVTILYRYAGQPASSGIAASGGHFWDVPRGMYYTAAVDWAYANGIVTGYGGTGMFGPDDPITRQDLMTMLYRFAKRCGIGGSTAFTKSFPDQGSIDSYAVAALGWANARGIITGDMSSGTAIIMPHAYTTRAQAAKIFTVLMRDTLAGASVKGMSWSLDSVTSANSYLLVGSTVKLTAKVSGLTKGLTYTFGWYNSAGESWQGQAGSSPSFDFYLGGSGTFTLWCRVTDKDGISFEKTCNVVVWKSATPKVYSSNNTATWTVSPALTAGDASRFTFEYTWLKGKSESSAVKVGSKASSKATSASATFTEQNYYWFRVKATDPEGHSSTASVRVLYAPSGKIGYQNPSYYYQVSSYNVSPYPGASGIFAYVTPSRISADATREDCVETFIGRAYEYLGTAYVWDYACAPGVGVDCIGMVYQCAYACGMDLGEFNPYLHFATGPSGWHSHDAMNMWDYGSIWKSANLSYRQRGDLIFYPGHVAIYLGNNQILQALPGVGVHIAGLWSAGTPLGIGRLFV